MNGTDLTSLIFGSLAHGEDDLRFDVGAVPA